MAKVTNLTFQFKSGNQFSGKQGRFEIEGLTVGSEIEFDEITFYVEDEKYEGGISTFTSANLSAEELFSDVVNAYFRDDVTDFEFNNDWSIFDSIKNRSKYQGQILISFPQDYIGIVDFECMLKTKEYGFYSHDDLFLMLDDDNGIVTDTETFFAEALDDEIEDIQSGKKKALYTGEEFDTYVAEYFGESRRINTMKLNLFENRNAQNWENIGDVNFLDGGFIISDNGDGTYDFVRCNYVYDTPDDEYVYLIEDGTVDINDSWIDVDAVESYADCKKDTDPMWFARACVDYYGGENFGAVGVPRGLDDYSDYLYTAEGVEEYMKGYDLPSDIYFG